MIWYAAYGSNVHWDRFRCYIQGGCPQGGLRHYQGARNPARPVDDRPVVLPHRLYFARESSVWGGYGVAFVHREASQEPHHEPSSGKAQTETLARAWLLHKEQLEDVAMQESHLPEPLPIDLERLRAEGRQVLNPEAWYGCVEYCGELDGHPLVTLTHQAFSPSLLNTPAWPYLSYVARGIAESHRLNAEQVAAYLTEAPGARGLDRERVCELV